MGLYGNSYTTNPIIYHASSLSTGTSRIQAELNALPNHAIRSVTVSLDTATTFAYTYATTNGGAGPSSFDCSAASACWLVTFSGLPGNSGYQYPLECNDGATHSTSQMPGLVAGVATCSVKTLELSSIANADPKSSTYTATLTEQKTCSGRGTCDGD